MVLSDVRSGRMIFVVRRVSVRGQNDLIAEGGRTARCRVHTKLRCISTHNDTPNRISGQPFIEFSVQKGVRCLFSDNRVVSRNEQSLF